HAAARLEDARRGPARNGILRQRYEIHVPLPPAPPRSCSIAAAGERRQGETVAGPVDRPRKAKAPGRTRALVARIPHAEVSVEPVPAPGLRAVGVGSVGSGPERLRADDLAAAAVDGEQERPAAGTAGVDDGDLAAHVAVVEVLPAVTKQPVLDHLAGQAAPAVRRHPLGIGVASGPRAVVVIV